MRMGLRAFTIAAWMSLIGAAPALADVTLFIGTTTTPANRQVRGFSAGLGLLIVAFEFEYSSTHEDFEDVAPSLKTGVGNVLLQTPFAIHGVQPYFTTGGGSTARHSARATTRGSHSTRAAVSRSRWQGLCGCDWIIGSSNWTATR